MSRLYYDKPTNYDVKRALPIGNGLLGGFVFSEPLGAHISLNEETIWSGGPLDRVNKDAKPNLEKVRGLIFDGKISEAERLLKFAFSGVPQSERVYQMAGDFYIDYMDVIKEPVNYERYLDLEKALHFSKVTDKKSGLTIDNECFVSEENNVIACKVTGNGKRINLAAMIMRDVFYDGCKADGDTTYFVCKTSDGVLSFCVGLTAMADKDATIHTIGEHIVIENAKEVVFYISIISNYEAVLGLCNIDVCEDVKKTLEKAKKAGYEKMKSCHIENYQSVFMNTNLEFFYEETVRYDEFCEEDVRDGNSDCETECNDSDIPPKRISDENIPVDKLLYCIKDAMQPAHYERGIVEECRFENWIERAIKRYYDYSKYLLISSSHRNSKLPANLQGIWNNSMTPPWGSKFTININTEMNYWPAEMWGLGSCHMPLFSHMERMLPRGKKVAKDMYGCRGFVAHHNTDLWGDCAPQDMYIPATYWVMGAAWLSTHIWLHYSYTKDVEFLERMYPVIYESVLFFHDFLVKKDGKFLTCPSVSPENTFILPNGEKGRNTYSVTMDNQIMRQLFTDYLKITEVLDKSHDDGDFIEKTKEILEKLPETKIGSDGRILEWIDEYDEEEVGHRHISHLYGLFPGNEIVPDNEDGFCDAAKKTLEKRLEGGGGHTGWSRAWIINMYASLWAADEAYGNLIDLLTKSTQDNFLDTHPPFQIDGNFGALSGIGQMLLQSNDDRTVILPALPKYICDGKVTNIRGRGGISYTFSWKKGELVSLDATGCFDGASAVVVYNGEKIKLELQKNETRKLL